MKIYVDGDCHDCPFAGWTHPEETKKRPVCSAEDRWLPAMHLSGSELNMPPGWCPLREGKVVVKMVKP